MLISNLAVCLQFWIHHLENTNSSLIFAWFETLCYIDIGRESGSSTELKITRRIPLLYALSWQKNLPNLNPDAQSAQVLRLEIMFCHIYKMSFLIV